VGASSSTLTVPRSSIDSAARARERQTAGGGQQQCEAKENVFIFLKSTGSPKKIGNLLAQNGSGKH